MTLIFTFRMCHTEMTAVLAAADLFCDDGKVSKALFHDNTLKAYLFEKLQLEYTRRIEMCCC